MKLTLNQKFEYTLFGLSNLFFATPLLLTWVILIIGIFFQDPIEEHVEYFPIVWLLVLIIKVPFVIFAYAVSEDMRFLLDKFTPIWKLLGFALFVDTVCFVVQYIIIAIYDISLFGDNNLTKTLIPYLYMLGGVTPSYLVFLLFKNHLKVKRPAKSDE